MESRTAAIVIVGNEVLSGKVEDARRSLRGLTLHVTCGPRGAALATVRKRRDMRDRQVDALGG
jgi:molybdopterin-biosynthesis enzyme MoeA-like protein